MYQTVTAEWQEHKGHRVREIEGVGREWQKIDTQITF